MPGSQKVATNVAKTNFLRPVEEMHEQGEIEDVEEDNKNGDRAEMESRAIDNSVPTWNNRHGTESARDKNLNVYQSNYIAGQLQ